MDPFHCCWLSTATLVCLISIVTMILQVACEEGNLAEVNSYLPRGKRTPFMERKLRALQAGRPSDLPDSSQAIHSLPEMATSLLGVRLPLFQVYVPSYQGS